MIIEFTEMEVLAPPIIAIVENGNLIMKPENMNQKKQLLKSLSKSSQMLKECDEAMNRLLTDPDCEVKLIDYPSTYKEINHRRIELDRLICALTIAIEHEFYNRKEMQEDLQRIRLRVEILCS